MRAGPLESRHVWSLPCPDASNSSRSISTPPTRSIRSLDTTSLHRSALGSFARIDLRKLLHKQRGVTRLKSLLAVRSDLGYSPSHLGSVPKEILMMFATCCAKFCCSGMSTSHTHFISQTPTPRRANRARLKKPLYENGLHRRSALCRDSNCLVRTKLPDSACFQQPGKRWRRPLGRTGAG